MTDLSTQERRLLLEYSKRFGVADLYSGLTTPQSAFVFDEHRRKVARCGRRAGKTHMAPRYLANICQRYPGSRCLYITLTQNNAKDLVWRPLLALNSTEGLGFLPNKTELLAEFPNGSTIKVSGCPDESEIIKFLGFKYKLVIIDEAQSFGPWIKQLINNVLAPALEDDKGTLVLIGTPGPVCAGYFHDITTDPDRYGWSAHKWTVFDNTEFPVWAGLSEEDMLEAQEDWKARVLIEQRLDENHPTYLREWLGEWVMSDDRIIVHMSGQNRMKRLDVPDFKAKKMGCTLGIDLGWHDATAWEVVGYDRYDQKAYQLEEVVKNELTLPKIISITEALVEKYSPERIRIDSAGAGKIILESLAEEIRKRYRIPIEAADKRSKGAFMRILDGDAIYGHMVVIEGSILDKQLSTLQWNDEFRVEAEGQACDAFDAFLYAWRDAVHYSKLQRPESKPGIGTSEYWALQERLMLDGELLEHSKKHEDDENDSDWLEEYDNC